jgi:hypothetical protein
MEVTQSGSVLGAAITLADGSAFPSILKRSTDSRVADRRPVERPTVTQQPIQLGTEVLAAKAVEPLSLRRG